MASSLDETTSVLKTPGHIVYDEVLLNASNKETCFLEISPGDDCGPLSCRLFSKTIDRKLEYLALSYTWELNAPLCHNLHWQYCSYSQSSSVDKSNMDLDQGRQPRNLGYFHGIRTYSKWISRDPNNKKWISVPDINLLKLSFLHLAHPITRI
jgi:hypothetical protein